ncbi:hypothetical protein PISMIDRAFT_679467 [Pisolithus microcarpus 441]|uniref:Unplaced genomic scaffold scaffold_43, whole genome shotgun sequence n=1 Tax=Pisolithus microcarpus 441 TaxID=765257 RepID=A0A0C9ZUI6_9AGAM|nr:hypothetical protein BKA83DRAFT_679467 [Pisolithus microcarpus]KIK23343.1 hypothetical protein PISMIDRAFT_679467 [Pisolithus microcarpus 441]
MHYEVVYCISGYIFILQAIVVFSIGTPDPKYDFRQRSSSADHDSAGVITMAHAVWKSKPGPVRFFLR